MRKIVVGCVDLHLIWQIPPQAVITVATVLEKVKYTQPLLKLNWYDCTCIIIIIINNNNYSDPVGISMYVQTIASIKRTQNKFNECTSRQSPFEGP